VFLFGDGAETERRCSAEDPQQAYDVFRTFRDELRGDPVMLSIEDPAAEEALALMIGSGTAVRIRGAERPRTEYSILGHPNRIGSFAMRFFEDGYDGLGGLGAWYASAAELDLPPEERGARRAAAITDEREALNEVLRIWAHNGIVDVDGEHYVFFHTDTLAESPDDRAALVVLIETLGLQRVPLPEGAAEGEVWVRTDPRIEVEIENWS